jgi:creatinine amidohydrolase
MVSSNQEGSGSEGSEATANGYSVFDGTMADMTYVQIEEASKGKAIILLPVGVIEEHGPHLPLGVDVYGSYLIAKMVRADLEKKGIRSLIAPPFYWGMNNATASFAGSFTVREETMVGLLWDIMASLKRWGFEKVFVLNHHYDRDHSRILNVAILKSRLDIGIRVYWLIDDFIATSLGFRGREPHLLIFKAPPKPPSQFLEIHADRYETSFMMHYFPDLVGWDCVKSLKSSDVTAQAFKVWRQGWEDARKVTPQGFVGDPTLASPEEGKKAIETFGKEAADLIERFLQGQYQPPDLSH